MNSKPWWKSQTILSDIATLVMSVLPQVDKLYGTHIASSPLYTLALALLAAAGVHGRLNATTTITGGSQ